MSNFFDFLDNEPLDHPADWDRAQRKTVQEEDAESSVREAALEFSDRAALNRIEADADRFFDERDDFTPPPAPGATFRETCRKCNGRGDFIGWSGRRLGSCFACKGVGSFERKTSPEVRAKARAATTARKERIVTETREAFAVAHPAEWKWMAAKCGTFNFALAMIKAVEDFGDLTERQMETVQRLMAQDAARAAERATRVATAPVVDVSKLTAAWAHAKAKADRPNAMGVWVRPLRLQSGDLAMRFSEGSEGSQWAGMIFVKTEEGGKKLGSIKGGKFTPRFECSDAEKAAVLDACTDPKKAALAFAKAWSKCAVCNRTLTNDVSIEAAMGPICRERFGW